MIKMMVIILLPLFSACVSVGLSSDTFREEYGNKYKIRVLIWVHSIEFVPKYSTETSVLWKRDNPEASKDTRRKMEGYYYVIYNVTQKDSGRYILRNSDETTFSTKTVEVVANTRTISLMSGEQLAFSFDLEPNSCNIYFFPEFDHEIQIVRQGVLLLDSDQSGCVGFKLLKPCWISNKAAQMSCAGRFEVRDHDDKALTVLLEMKPSKFNSTYLFAGIGSLVFALLSCCLKYCCCGKGSSKKDSTESAAESDAAAAPDNNDQPSVYYHKYDQEPVGLRPNQPTEPSETPCHTETSHAASDLLIHNPPTELPPPYSEVSAPAEQTDAPTFPLCSDQEPQFKIKGINFNMNTHHTDVYTSDKLNFL
ncbi:uncharacterized protein LOC121643557 [Melanotaenia boesemani]|uniref:uncharacterized protein LOC121643557 n=1 Tax=Melanotaenia boesemani TaxID=1250792 RepID=UPI001C03EEB1|nr:uncharacterized protein LOC121643557 [Melanotaenia boesemani]